MGASRVSIACIVVSYEVMDGARGAPAIVPRHSPNPMRAKPSRSQNPRKIDLVAVFEKPALLTGRKRDGLRAAPRQLQQTTARLLRRAGHRSARQRSPRLQIASVARVVRDELRERPVHVREPHATQAHWR